ncbi:Ppx/GppA phosphatase family protein [Pannonibacter indicus]|uniref:Ppx/GppA phosphatase family protein n=1 Tax=Pannonibacter indicus TaxID=466044 RepID=UPI0035AFBC91
MSASSKASSPQGGQAGSDHSGRNGQTGFGSASGSGSGSGSGSASAPGNQPRHARGGRPGFKGRSAGAAAGASSGPSSGQPSHQLLDSPQSSGPGTRNEAGHLATGQAAHPGAETDGAGGRGRRRRRGRGATRGAHSASAHPAARGASGPDQAGGEPAAHPAAYNAARQAVEPGSHSRAQPGHDLQQVRRSGHEAGRSGDADGDLYAALDLGTNNCRLLIAKPDERGFRVVDAYSRIVRLGEGVGASRRLSDAAMERAIEALDSCHRKLAERGVRRSRLIATEACRAAENGEEFIARVQRETGLALEIVNRETEARLAVAGCASLVDRDADGVLLFDIGGGSSEIVWLDLRNRGGARGYALTRFIRAWVSLPVGVVNLAERHGGMDVSHEVFEAMIDDVSSHLDGSALGAGLREAMASSNMHMLGTSGTVTTLAGVHFGLRRYDRRRVDGAWLADEDVSAMVAKLRDMSYRERVENPCIGADRADLVLAGCAILEAIRRRWTCARLRVADRGLREGILTELMAADGVWSRGGRGHKGQKGRS